MFIYIFYFLARIFKMKKKEYAMLKMCKKRMQKTILCKVMDSMIEHMIIYVANFLL